MRKKLFCPLWDVHGTSHSHFWCLGALNSILKFLLKSDGAVTGYRMMSGQLHGYISCNGIGPDVPLPQRLDVQS